MTLSHRILISNGAESLWAPFQLDRWHPTQFPDLKYSDWFELDAEGFAKKRQILRDCFTAGHTAALLRHPEGLKAIFFDMDATLIQQETIDELAKEAGVYPAVRIITERAMAGDLDFTAALLERVATLKDLPATILEQVTARLTLQPGVEELANFVLNKGLKLFLISGGFMPVAEPFAKRLKFSGCHANFLEIQDGKLTGRVTGTIVDGAEKARYVQRICAEHRWQLDQVVAIGDGANDAQMIQLTPYGIGFRPKKALWPFLAMANQTGDHRALITALWDRY